MEKRNETIDKLIEGYLSGKLRDEEFTALKQFLAAHPSNLAYFDQYRLAWDPADQTYTEMQWRNLKSKMARLKTLDRTFAESIRIPRVWLRIAGILILGLLAGSVITSTFLYKYNRNSGALVISAPRGEKSFMNLSDGTKVWLNGGSSLTTTSNYGLADRSVSLTGEAYFEVSENKRLPFIVTTDQIRIRVLGTEFNISAYPDQELVETTLKEGRIELSPVKKGTFRGFIMRSNEIAIFNRMTSDMQRTKVDVETKIAWKNNQLIMENENYVKVFKKLENWYGVNFRFVNAPANEPDYSMTIKTETLSEILGLISLITPLEYEIKGEDILITYK